MRLPLSQSSKRLSQISSDVWSVHLEAVKRKDQGEDIILLSVGDPDFPTPPEISNHLVQQVNAGRTHYSPVAGEKNLRQALADLETACTGKKFNPEQFIILPGATAALYVVFACLLNSGDEVIIPEPMYVGYEGIFEALGARIHPVALDEGKDFALNVDEIKKAITPATRAVLVNTPGNPCGNIIATDILAELAELCRANNLWLVCDEVYSLFSYDEPHLSLLKSTIDLDNTVVIDSLSKSHAMSGWRIGWAVAPPELVQRLEELSGAIFFGCSQFIQDAAAYALSVNEPHLLKMKEEYQRRRDYVVGRVQNMSQLSCSVPKAGMFAMMDVSQVSPDGDAFATSLLRLTGISTIPGSGFGTNTSNYVRISLTQPLSVLNEAFDRIENVLPDIIAAAHKK